MEQKNYRTKSRTEIMDYLKSHNNSSFSATDIVKYLRDNNSTVNPTTVYRNLDKLVESGTVIRYKTAESDSVKYQCVLKDGSCKKHLHMQCEKCGKLIHLECHFMDEISEHLYADHGFKLQCEGSVLMGTCADCQ